MQRSDVEAGARTIGLQVMILMPAPSDEIDAAFPSSCANGADALYVGADVFFFTHR